MALGDLSLQQSKILRLLRDSRPCWVTNIECWTQFRTMRHLARMGFVELVGMPGHWRATITPGGVGKLARHDQKRI